MESVKYLTKQFNELTSNELYKILQLRSNIFVVEQMCIFLDMDGNDDKAYHVYAYIEKDNNHEIIATTRLFNMNDSHKGYQSIGRVCLHSNYRGLGIGKQLMKYSIAMCEDLFGKGPIKIGAQLYLNKFYIELGFVNDGKVYDEDGIAHIHMIRSI
jgi:ElaA protein